VQLQSAAERSKTLAAQASSAADADRDDLVLSDEEEEGYLYRHENRRAPASTPGGRNAIADVKEVPLASTSAAVQQKMTGKVIRI
jgi:hypothetical protein